MIKKKINIYNDFINKEVINICIILLYQNEGLQLKEIQITKSLNKKFDQQQEDIIKKFGIDYDNNKNK